MSVVVLYATTADKFKVEFDAWVAATLPTSVDQVIRSHKKGEWIVRFTP